MHWKKNKASITTNLPKERNQTEKFRSKRFGPEFNTKVLHASEVPTTWIETTAAAPVKSTKPAIRHRYKARFSSVRPVLKKKKLAWLYKKFGRKKRKHRRWLFKRKVTIGSFEFKKKYYAARREWIAPWVKRLKLRRRFFFAFKKRKFSLRLRALCSRKGGRKRRSFTMNVRYLRFHRRFFRRVVGKSLDIQGYSATVVNVTKVPWRYREKAPRTLYKFTKAAKMLTFRQRQSVRTFFPKSIVQLAKWRGAKIFRKIRVLPGYVLKKLKRQKKNMRVFPLVRYQQRLQKKFMAMRKRLVLVRGYSRARLEGGLFSRNPDVGHLVGFGFKSRVINQRRIVSYRLKRRIIVGRGFSRRLMVVPGFFVRGSLSTPNTPSHKVFFSLFQKLHSRLVWKQKPKLLDKLYLFFSLPNKFSLYTLKVFTLMELLLTSVLQNLNLVKYAYLIPTICFNRIVRVNSVPVSNMFFFLSLTDSVSLYNRLSFFFFYQQQQSFFSTRFQMYLNLYWKKFQNMSSRKLWLTQSAVRNLVPEAFIFEYPNILFYSKPFRRIVQNVFSQASFDDRVLFKGPNRSFNAQQALFKTKLFAYANFYK